MRLLALSALALMLANAAPTRAAESYDNCTGFVDSVPAVISTQGTWCLRADQSTAIDSGAAITINANNVTLDCNHFKLGGLAAGAGTETNGVQSHSRLNLTVRNCNIRGFFRGLRTEFGGGHVIEDNRFEANTVIGISVASDNSLVRRNQVLDTQGSVLFPGETYGVVAIGNDVHVTDNLVSGVLTISESGYAYGIYHTNYSGGGSVARNSIAGLAPGTTGAIYGIYGIGYLMIVGNTVQGTAGNPLSVGILCGNSQGTARDNTLDRWDTAVGQCVSSNNLINPN